MRRLTIVFLLAFSALVWIWGAVSAETLPETPIITDTIDCRPSRSSKATTFTIVGELWEDNNANGYLDEQPVTDPGPLDLIGSCNVNGNTITKTYSITSPYSLTVYFDAATPISLNLNFEQLPGYTFSPIPPNNGADTNDVDANGNAPSLASITGTTYIISAGYVPPAIVGNYVWLDSTPNDIQDADEQGVGGILVSLFSMDATLYFSTTTDSNGLYSFVVPYDTQNFDQPFQLQFIIPANCSFVAPNQGKEFFDSDVTSPAGRTEQFFLHVGLNDFYDAGIVADCVPSAIGLRAISAETPFSPFLLLPFLWMSWRVVFGRR